MIPLRWFVLIAASFRYDLQTGADFQYQRWD